MDYRKQIRRDRRYAKFARVMGWAFILIGATFLLYGLITLTVVGSPKAIIVLFGGAAIALIGVNLRSDGVELAAVTERHDRGPEA